MPQLLGKAGTEWKMHMQANAGRAAGRQVPAGGCRGSGTGCSCQEKPHSSHPTHPDPRASPNISASGREALCLRFADWDLASPGGYFILFGFILFYFYLFVFLQGEPKKKKEKRRFVYLGDVLGISLNLILCPDSLCLWSLPGSKIAECILNVRGVWFWFCLGFFC